MSRFIAPPELREDYQTAAEHVLPRTWGGFDRKEWAEHFARQEPHLEEALGGICWDYHDRPIVAAAALLLEHLAGYDQYDPKAYRKGIADGFRKVASMIEDGGRRK